MLTVKQAKDYVYSGPPSSHNIPYKRVWMSIIHELRQEGRIPSAGSATSIYRERYTGLDENSVPKEYKAYEYEKQLTTDKILTKLLKEPELFMGSDNVELQKALSAIPKPSGYDEYAKRESTGWDKESWRSLAEEIPKKLEEQRKQKLEEQVGLEAETAKIPKEVRDQQFLARDEKARQERQKARVERQKVRDELKKFLREDKT